jgi:5,6-dimethylbenzimidazole synthase
MREFVPDTTIPEPVLARLLAAAHAAPSVGLMQPWRFVRITDAGLRTRLHALVDEERRLTAELLVVALGEDRSRHVFGRRTMPQMDLASVSCAIQNLWLAARVEGLGLGWVSIFDPDRLARLLNMPADAEPVAILCLGPVPAFPDRPVLELEAWTSPRPLAEFVSENCWAPTSTSPT